MEIINISSEAFDEIVSRFQSFRDKVLALCQKHNNKQMNDWLDNQDVCLLLNISPRTLQTYRNNGKIGFTRINHKIYYTASDIQKFLHPDTDINNGNIDNIKLKQK
ncbi:helix-turn-helix domain-containing protein [Dysgonomonas sp. HDW5B]|uniref:helix-turn-helix domain-containing protein n=1 Tax=Dysgonomonas sp. HDW5B TaxID=2714927 RepID=UPI0014099F34|nr:helix-turn-helix domain-containing protein [Dysgonomonas sp. HDW5B]QIK54465.1 helix-turn-helix domain-containing protein [Dysgonomonas sp. HDW5B]